MNMAELGAILVAAIFGTLAIAFLLRRGNWPAQRGRMPSSNPTQEGAVFLFCDDALADATNDAWALISHNTKNVNDFDAMLAAVSAEFPKLQEMLAGTAMAEFRLRSARDPKVFVDVQRSGNRLRLSINGDTRAAYLAAAERLSNGAQDSQVTLFESITANSSQLIWQEDGSGDLLWANDAYARTLSKHTRRSLFDIEKTEQIQRIAVRLEGEPKERWFDVSSVAHADGFLHFANDTTESVRADAARTEFVKTLGKTFAELSIGLAIFDKSRRLTMFNPALVDMTNLPVDFLSASPVIDTVLDRLREMRMMPEPKNYVSWREQFTAVETAAKDGTYSKNWALPDGQTYRVTGKPHPDGAFALLFEDISAEVSLTRRFRLDIETGQAVLDTLSDAIAVFSSTGTLVMSNRAYGDLWSSSAERIMEHRVLRSEMKTWQNHCVPSLMWNEMRDFIQQLGARKPWTDNALLDDGRHLHCHASPIAGGMTMVRFVVAKPRRPELAKLTQPDPAIHAGKR